MRENATVKIKLRRLAVYLKYSFPLICSAFLWLSCILPVWRFSRGDGEERVYQSLAGIVSSAFKASNTILGKTGTTENDVALAKDLIPSIWIFWIIIAVVTLLSLILFAFSMAALRKDPLSRECNRIKVWFKAFFPGSLVHFLLPLFTLIPLFEPYYIAGRFEKYYAVSGTSEGAMGTEYTYFSYSVSAWGINPILLLSLLIVLSLVIYVLAIPYQRSQKLDMYTYFEPEPEEKNCKSARKNLH